MHPDSTVLVRAWSAAGLLLMCAARLACCQTSAQEVVEALHLSPLVPEGGFLLETFRDPGEISQACLPSGFVGPRNFSTETYFLLSLTTVSSLHKLTTREVWHFYLGRPIIISELRPDGSLKETLLGNDFAAGQKPQYTILPDSWYGARTSEPNGTGPLADLQQTSDFALVGNSVAPGYDMADFTEGNRSQLLALYPQHTETINLLLPEA
ncbi:hypothetical protein ABBQ38_012679 [Trebouxia sp. C0009 RCD-2024]